MAADVTVPAWLKGTMLLAVTLAAGIAIGVSYERRQTAHEPGMNHMMHSLRAELGLDSVRLRLDPRAPSEQPQQPGAACLARSLVPRQPAHDRVEPGRE